MHVHTFTPFTPRYLILFPVRLVLLVLSASAIIATFCIITAIMPPSPTLTAIERRLVQVGVPLSPCHPPSQP